MGGIDWAGFDLALELVGVRDVELLLRGLLVIKGHKKSTDASPAIEPEPD